MERKHYLRKPESLDPVNPHTRLRWYDHLVPITRDGKTGSLFIKEITLGTPDGNPIPSAYPPVICFPGYGCNGNLFRISSDGRVRAMDTDNSFANDLATRGWDVWLVHPYYGKRIYERYVRQFLGVPYQSLGPTHFDHLLQEDVPTALNYVLTTSQAWSVDWIGFSMGGMLMYAYLSLHPNAPIGKVITIGAPIEFGTEIRLAMAITHHAAVTTSLAGLFGAATDHARFFTDMLSKVPIRLQSLMFPVYYLYNPNKMSTEVASSFLQYVIENPGRALTRSFLSWIGENSFPYPMEEIRTPFHLIYGEADRLATPYGVLQAKKHMTQAPVETTVIPGAGHSDQILGENARQVREIVVQTLKREAV